MASTTTREELLAFMNRDWALARRTKDEAIARWVRHAGATAAFELAQGLLDQVWDRMVRDPDDLEGLLQLTEKLDRAGAQRR